MSTEHIKSVKRAIERLQRDEIEVLGKIATDNRPEDREEYRDIRDTLDTLNSQMHEGQTLVAKILRRLHLIK